MSGNTKSTFNLDDLKKLKEQLKKAKEEGNNKNVAPKQSIGNKIISIMILIGLIVSVIVIVVLNIGTLLMPKNSVTIIISDQNGEVIDGLELQLQSEENFYTFKYSEESGPNVTELGFKPGNYNIVFINIPQNYNCDKIIDSFVMSEGDKVKLEYRCTKE